jgi:hypothetical protein
VKKLLLRLLFGSDEMMTKFFDLVRVRKAAIAEHLNNKRLLEEHEAGVKKLEEHKASYAEIKEGVEKAYRLELE